ncbi:hypothetical protein N7517_006796 [Penicillium concentricum]|uniref:F-box domain-containing protein n=1 Tax=Penicillium concentricum TaxID=293559 RepID=A0A9W9SB64_9EURO|nr:uncharacterized protein N7517_006796 [Penicillium concentricum]KAJ5374790.1 hypothetical protein N7517_006796 [Penicillium concentricum]
MDPFAKLPTEIILLILESCCDFASLDGLQKISSRAEQVFNISLSGGALQSASVSSINSLAAARQAVTTAAKVHHTSCACLQHLVNRLESAKPHRPIAPAADLTERMHGRLPESHGETSLLAIYPPSWIESYRTHRGLWNLELFRHIYNAAPTRWSWSTHDLDFFTEQYVEWCRLEWGLDGIQTISECVVDLCFTAPTTLSHRFLFLIAIPSPTNLALRACWSLPVVPTDTQVGSTWGRCRSTAEGRSNVLHSYSGGKQGPHNPLWKLDFREFRRLGIPLWDGWRV